MMEDSCTLIKKHLLLAAEAQHLDAWFEYLSGKQLVCDHIPSLYNLSLQLPGGIKRFLPSIRTIFQKYIYRVSYAVWLEVESAIPLTRHQGDALKRKIMDKLKVNKIFFVEKINPSLSGGLKIKVHDYLINASLSRGLEKTLKDQLNGIII